MPAPQPPTWPEVTDHATGGGGPPEPVADRLAAAPRGWRRWIPWLTGLYFAAVFVSASLTSSGDAVFTGVVFPLVVVTVWYCLRRPRHSLVQGLIAVGLGLAVIAGDAVMPEPYGAFPAVLFGCLSAAGWYGATGMLEQHRGSAPGRSEGPPRMGRLVGLGLVVGLVLGVVNLLMGVGGGDPLGVQPASDTARALVGALRPGIWEEVTFHFFPLAWWIAVRGSLPTTRWGTVGMYAWLILPHAAIHYAGLPLVEAVGTTLLLGAVFGLPLVWLNVRRGVVAAIIAHWAVDAIRFALGWW